MNQNDFIELVQQRQSVRAYLPDPVDKDKIIRCLEAARLAPSACNAQPWTYIVVDQVDLKNRLADLTMDRVVPLNHFTRQAPVHIVIVVEKANLTSRFGAAVKQRPFAWIDLGITAEHICLQAAAEGLGTCMLGWFNEKRVRSLLNIPRHKRVGLIITLGYPAEDLVRPKIRKDIDQISRWNGY